MTTPGTRSRRATAFLLLTILVLGFVVVAQHRREMRLTQALALFRNRAHQNIYRRVDRASGPLGRSPWLAVSWGATASLEEVIAQFRVFTNRPSWGLRSGFPIEVDAVGLKEAGQSLTTRVLLPPGLSEDVSLHELLHRILEPLHLASEIKDGALLITSTQAVERSHERIRKFLDQPILLTWPDGASLEDVIDQVRLSTLGPEFPLGLPVYADPVNLDDSDLRKTIVASSPKEELPIYEHLARVLGPLQMKYELRNGALMILPSQKADEPGEAQGSRLE